MIMGVGEPFERGTHRQPGNPVDLRVRRPGHRLQDDSGPVVDLLEAGVACLIGDRVQRHAEPNRDAGFFAYFTYRTHRHRFSSLNLSLRERPVVVPRPMDDHDFDALRLMFPRHNSTAGKNQSMRALRLLGGAGGADRMHRTATWRPRDAGWWR